MRVLGGIVAGVVALVLLIGVIYGATVGYYQVLPWFYGQEFKAVRKSQPYVTTQQTSLVTLYVGYQKAKAAGQDGQAAAILLQMKQQAALIGPDQVPPEIAQFLATH